ncbi:hypothetical protein B7494_g6724 [Chlorociboria aeruginascens]|nr:hypothetical protein B7494_g6724 [Chlorociboria aeruginascens]
MIRADSRLRKTSLVDLLLWSTCLKHALHANANVRIKVLVHSTRPGRCDRKTEAQRTHSISIAAGVLDNLSKIWLTKRALRELNQTKKQHRECLPYPRTHWPVTRNFLAVWKRDHPSGSDILDSCTAEALKHIGHLARHGGLDVSDLRGAGVDAKKEGQVTKSMIPVIEGKIRDAKCLSGTIPLRNLGPLTDGTLVPENPDLYYGARPERLNQRVRDDLNDQIIPSTQDDLPIAPNFFIAAKGPDGSLAVARRQVSYDATLGERGQYYMHQLKAYAMTSDADTFRKGAAAFWNLRDYAEEQRNGATQRANERSKKIEDVEVKDVDNEDLQVGSSDEAFSFARGISNSISGSLVDAQESETSTDEVYIPPPAKRAARQAHRNRRRKVQTNESSSLRSVET